VSKLTINHTNNRFKYFN